MKRLSMFFLLSGFFILPAQANDFRDAAVEGLFDRVVIMGASISVSQEAESPGLLLARAAGTPEDRIHIFAKGGVPSSYHKDSLDEIARLRPSLIIALDLFYHDFKFSLFLRKAKKEYLQEYIRSLHETGAVVVIGNIPDLVLLRNEHANRYLDELVEEFPRMILVDVNRLNDMAGRDGVVANAGGKEVLLTRQDLFHDREHPNILGSTLLANFILEHLRARFPDCCDGFFPLDLSPHVSSDSM